ncbi:MAG: branched-chain-amino-acid transaminase [Candidatus Bathyarchaeota archaeon]|nr:branched-chain-amino-acid transaminase [Candidatus Bathyarchaeota archaeon]
MSKKEELQIYIDGKYYLKSEAKVSVYDHGFLYGDGVFEGIRVYDGVVFKLKEHVQRIYASAHAMMLKIPMTQEEMVQAVVETVKKNNLKDSYVRLIVTRGVGDLGLDPRKCSLPSVIIIADHIVLHDGEAKTKGITTMVSWVRRNPVDGSSHEIKSLNYLNSIMAKIEANMSGVDEAICLTPNGCVAEGVGENIFMVKNGKISTPPTSTGALEGITSNAVMELAKKLGYEVVVENLTMFMLFNADELFFTGSAAEIVPIRMVNWRQINNGAAGTITKKLMAEFRKLTRDPTQGTAVYS